MASDTTLPFTVRCVYGAFSESLAIAERSGDGLECMFDTGTKISGVKESHVIVVCSVDDMVSVSLIKARKTNSELHAPFDIGLRGQ